MQDVKTHIHPICIIQKDAASAKVEKKVYRDPRESHLTAVKRIFRYLKGIINLGLYYRKSKDYKLVGYCDIDYVGDRLERKRTSGSSQFLGDNLISWSSKRQSTIALSTTEVEYISASGCNTQML
ncbi:secreted RxLR effector protein 161-like [Lathyrus oleraceus]|uniref:secreted RxLR effector protein 161-like n=1 Tax=Pisum sativum TaxID=3888 RepID=UPI0021D0F4D1|nr:secreted RxLR effector protein 161-like [Pisum sativum]